MLRHFLRHEAPDQVGGAARRVGHDDPHRPPGIVGRSGLGLACAGGNQRQQRDDNADRTSHRASSLRGLRCLARIGGRCSEAWLLLAIRRLSQTSAIGRKLSTAGANHEGAGGLAEPLPAAMPEHRQPGHSGFGAARRSGRRNVQSLWRPLAPELPFGVASQRARHFAQVRWFVGIKASSARRCLNGAIGRDQHEHRIANRMPVADPG